jgi:hypothetical protein
MTPSLGSGAGISKKKKGPASLRRCWLLVDNPRRGPPCGVNQQSALLCEKHERENENEKLNLYLVIIFYDV